MVKPVSTKNTKQKLAGYGSGHLPVIWEAETGELLEHWRRRLQLAEMAPLHSSLGDTVRLHLKKIKQKTEMPFSPFSKH